MTDTHWWHGIGRTMSPAEAFGQNVARHRRELGWDQAGLARRLTALGIPARQNTVSRIENATRPVSVDELIALSRILGPDDMGVADEQIAMLLLQDPGVLAAKSRLSAQKAYRETRDRLRKLQAQQDDLDREIAKATKALAQMQQQALTGGGDDGEPGETT